MDRTKRCSRRWAKGVEERRKKRREKKKAEEEKEKKGRELRRQFKGFFLGGRSSAAELCGARSAVGAQRCNWALGAGLAVERQWVGGRAPASDWLSKGRAAGRACTGLGLVGIVNITRTTAYRHNRPRPRRGRHRVLPSQPRPLQIAWANAAADCPSAAASGTNGVSAAGGLLLLLLRLFVCLAGLDASAGQTQQPKGAGRSS